MNASALPHLIRQMVYTDGTAVPRDHCIQHDNYVDTFRIMFEKKTHTSEDLKNVVQGFHEVVGEVNDLRDGIFSLRIRSLAGLNVEALNGILKPFWPVMTINHVHQLKVVRRPS